MGLGIIPLRAVVYQVLLLTVAIAIESGVLWRRLKITPKQGVQYATSINLLSTVLGWLTVFSLFGVESELSLGWSRGLKVAFLNFILFDEFTNESTSVLIVIGFITFFASFAVKQLGLVGLRWLLQAQPGQLVQPAEPEPEKSASTAIIRDLRKEPPDESLSQFSAVLFANAWSYSAILVILLARLALKSI